MLAVKKDVIFWLSVLWYDLKHLITLICTLVLFNLEFIDYIFCHMLQNVLYIQNVLFSSIIGRTVLCLYMSHEYIVCTLRQIIALYPEMFMVFTKLTRYKIYCYTEQKMLRKKPLLGPVQKL